MRSSKKICWICFMVLIFISAFGVRLYAVNTVEYDMVYDTLNYHNMANNFNENGFMGYSTQGKAQEPNAYITPGYPLFLSFVYNLFGADEAGDIYAVKVIQAFLSAITVLLVYFIGKKMINRWVGVIASLLLLIHPTFLVVCAFHLTETLYTFLFVLYLYIQIIAFEKNKKWLHTLTGVLFGLAVMVRPALFPMFLVLYFYRRIINKDKSALNNLLYFIIGLLVIMVPWWIRNFVLFGEIILLCTQTGNPLIAGAYPPEFAPASYPPIEEQFDAAVKAIINGFIEHPKEYFKWFTFDKFRLIFGKMYLADNLPKLGFMEIIHRICVVVGCIGVIPAILKKGTGVIAMYTIMTIGVQLIFIPENRYAFPIMPMLMLLTGYVFVEVLRFIGGKVKCKKV